MGSTIAVGGILAKWLGVGRPLPVLFSKVFRNSGPGFVKEYLQ
jgi:hypothetical protein